MPDRRIVIFSSKLHRGGAEKHLSLLLCELVRLGWEVHLVLSQRGGSYERMLSEKVRVYSPGWQIRSYSVSLILASITLFRVIKRVRPILSYSIQDGPNLINISVVSFLLSNLKLPVVIEVQNNPGTELTRSFVHRLYFSLCKFLYPRADRLIALSRGVEQAYTNAIPGLRQTPRQVIYNIGLAGERPPNPKIYSRQEWDLLSVGRLTRQKDYPTLIKAFSLAKKDLAASGINKTIRLTILGDGELQEELNDLVQSHGLSENVILKGFVNEVQQYYQTADIFVLSSRWEGFGNVIIEAMSYGVPVISTDCQYGPSEIIERPGSQGLLVPVGDASAMCASIVRLVSDPLLCQELSNEGYKRALDFTANDIATAYSMCFERVGNG